MDRLRLSIIVALVLGLSVNGATASVRYNYSGKKFSTFFSPYTSSSKVSGFVVLSAPLVANNSVNNLLPYVSFNFFDGVNHITNKNANPIYTGIQFGTDINANIISWAMTVEEYNGDEIVSHFPTCCSPIQDEGINRGGNGAYGSQLLLHGVWKETVLPAAAQAVQSAVPEPNTWMILLLGLGAVGAVLRYLPNRPVVGRRIGPIRDRETPAHTR